MNMFYYFIHPIFGCDLPVTSTKSLHQANGDPMVEMSEAFTSLGHGMTSNGYFDKRNLGSRTGVQSPASVDWQPDSQITTNRSENTFSHARCNIHTTNGIFLKNWWWTVVNLDLLIFLASEKSQRICVGRCQTSAMGIVLNRFIAAACTCMALAKRLG